MVKRLFVCSDIHDDREALIAFAKFAQDEEASRMLLLGDLNLRPYTAEQLQELLTSRSLLKFITDKDAHMNSKLQETRRVLDATGIPWYAIPGNYDKSLKDVFGNHDIHKECLRGEMAIFGYGGADAFPPHIQLLLQVQQANGTEEIITFDHQELFSLLQQEKPDIALIHNPPKGLCDDMYDGQNVGTQASLRYIVENGPKLVLSGHIHEAGPNGDKNNPHGVRGIASYRNPRTGKQTIVINPGNLGRFEVIGLPNLEKRMDFDHGTFVRVDVEDDGTPLRLVQYSVQPEKQVHQRGKIDRYIGPIRVIGDYNLAA